MKLLGALKAKVSEKEQIIDSLPVPEHEERCRKLQEEMTVGLKSQISLAEVLSGRRDAYLQSSLSLNRGYQDSISKLPLIIRGMKNEAVPSKNRVESAIRDLSLMEKVSLKSYMSQLTH